MTFNTLLLVLVPVFLWMVMMTYLVKTFYYQNKDPRGLFFSALIPLIGYLFLVVKSHIHIEWTVLGYLILGLVIIYNTVQVLQNKIIVSTVGTTCVSVSLLVIGL